MNIGNDVPKAALVTGGRGFIGQHLVRVLLGQGIIVVSVDTKPALEESREGLVEVVGDIRDRKLMEAVFADANFDCVYDLASFTEVGLSLEDYRCNVEQTEAMVEYCLKFDIKKYIFYSTQFVFRVPERLPASEEDYMPTEAYGQSKVMSEKIIRAKLDIKRWVVLRPTYIWGPGLDRFRDGLLYRLLKRQFLISNDDNTRRYYGYVETIAKQTLCMSTYNFRNLDRNVYYISDDAIELTRFCNALVIAMAGGKSWRVSPHFIRLLGAIGSLMARVGLSAPINTVQARELTTSFPVPVEATLSLTGVTVDLQRAANSTVEWAAQNPRFRSALQSSPGR